MRHRGWQWGNEKLLLGGSISRKAPFRLESHIQFFMGFFFSPLSQSKGWLIKGIGNIKEGKSTFTGWESTAGHPQH